MSGSKLEEWKAKALNLERELHEREQDLERYKGELIAANRRVEQLVGFMEKELDKARAIQHGLVPTEFPHIPGLEFSTKFVPSMERGGDYFDIFEHEDKFRFGIIISACTGHQLSSLFLSLLLKMTGQLEARKGIESNRVLQKMIASVGEQISERDRADLFYGVFDRRNFTFHYTSLGENVFLHHSVATNELALVKSPFPQFAKGFQHTLTEEVLPLNAKDRLIFCTPGVLEAQNPEGEEFGLDRVSKAVVAKIKGSVHDVRNEVLYQLEKFTGQANFSRDLTVLVIEVKDRVIKLARTQ